MVLQWCEDAAAAVKDLTSETNRNVDYVLFSLEDAKKKQPRMELFSMGKGGRAKVVEELLPSEDKVITGAFLASAIEESGSITHVRRKYVHVIWVGTRVGIMIKGKVNTSLTQPFKDLFPGCTMYVQMSDGDADELQPEALEAALIATAGAGDKPKRYSFTNRTLIGSLSLDDSSYNQNNSGRREPERIAAPKAALKKTAVEEEEEARRKAAQEVAEAKRKAAEDEARRKAAEEEARRIVAADEAQKRAEEEAQEQKRQQQLQEAEERRRKVAEKEALQKAAEEERLQKLKLQQEEEARRKAQEEEEALRAARAAMTPKAALGDKSLVMLISSMSGNMTTSTNQALATSMLKEMDVAPEIIDGAVPENKDLRNQLFGISGLRGTYPQFFLRQPDGGTFKFFGDFDTLVHYNDTNTLAQQIGGCATPKRQQQSTGGNASAFADVGSTLNGAKLLLLISSMSGNMVVSANQNRVEAILKGLHLPQDDIVTVDGCDPAVKDQRNELFGISGIRAKYPQLFLVAADGTSTSFVGNFDDISYLHDTNTLAKAIGLESKQATPVALSTLNGNKLVLLISSMSGNMEVAANQNRAENILKGLHLSKEEIEIIDGCDQSIKERRNELFGISGIRAKYPQLFLVHGKDGSTQFVGNFDDISYLHDTNTFAQAIGLASKAAGCAATTTESASEIAPKVSSSSPPVDPSSPPPPESTDTQLLPSSPTEEAAAATDTTTIPVERTKPDGGAHIPVEDIITEPLPFNETPKGETPVKSTSSESPPLKPFNTTSTSGSNIDNSVPDTEGQGEPAESAGGGAAEIVDDTPEPDDFIGKDQVQEFSDAPAASHDPTGSEENVVASDDLGIPAETNTDIREEPGVEEVEPPKEQESTADEPLKEAMDTPLENQPEVNSSPQIDIDPAAVQEKSEDTASDNDDSTSRQHSSTTVDSTTVDDNKQSSDGHAAGVDPSQQEKVEETDLSRDTPADITDVGEGIAGEPAGPTPEDSAEDLVDVPPTDNNVDEVESDADKAAEE